MILELGLKIKQITLKFSLFLVLLVVGDPLASPSGDSSSWQEKQI